MFGPMLNQSLAAFNKLIEEQHVENLHEGRRFLLECRLCALEARITTTSDPRKRRSYRFAAQHMLNEFAWNRPAALRVR